MTTILEPEPQEGRQWLHCRACDVAFALPISIPCTVDLWLAAVKHAQCPKCGIGTKGLDVYEPGRRPI